VIAAPPGWGYRPGHLLARPDTTDLPDLPFLRMLPSHSRTRAIEEAIGSVSGLAALLRPNDLVTKYGIPQQTASDVLKRLRTI
jgi:hypothetical protein